MTQSSKLEPWQQYRALAVSGVVPDVARREIAIAFKADPSEKSDLAVSLPAGVVAAMLLSIHQALHDLDQQVQDKAAIMQPITIMNAATANPILGNCAVLLTLKNGLRLPVILSKEAALRTIAAIQQAVGTLSNPPTVPKQLS